ncbi:MAG: hypothetical protein RR347_08560 [Anaerovoracaceae bacterium]
MKKRIKLIRLTLLGTRKNYTVPFKDGLNYISGHTSTGKTSILEMVDYALGSKSHKSYIEIGSSCTDVELELLIGDEQFRFRRKLSAFSDPVIVEEWSENKKKYLFYNRCEVDGPSNPHSLSNFMLEKLGLVDFSIKGQSFSFRDLYKYSYLKQIEIDNEDIMKEKSWDHDFKRKATFEIVFSLFDKTLDEFRSNLKKKLLEQQDLTIRLAGIKDFLLSADLPNIAELHRRSGLLLTEINTLKTQLSSFKQDKGINTSASNSLREKVGYLKTKLQNAAENKADQQDYLNRLHLLRNQYLSEIEKKEMAIEGYFTFNQYEFEFCPNCLKPLHHQNVTDTCYLCGNEKTEDKSELLILKKEITVIKRKVTELKKFIDSEDKKYDDMLSSERQLQKELSETETELQHLYTDYVNPYLEQIELLNYEIGNRNRLVSELEQNQKMFDEVDRIEQLLKDKETAVDNLKANIKKLSEVTPDKQVVLNGVSSRFSEILKAFSFPKLSNSYVDSKTYLPYVRGLKYDDIGSLAGVTLITMAYYLAILLEGLSDDSFHPNLLLLDSPRKNLGAKTRHDEEDEFKDEKIFNAIIQCFIDIDKKYHSSLQLIVVNNGYPEFLPNEHIIAEFDTERDDLPNGLIDDI